MLEDLRYNIADKLFARELDDAFDMGKREGARVATRKISFVINLKNKDLTKAQQVGYDKALVALHTAKEEVEQIFEIKIL